MPRLLFLWLFYLAVLLCIALPHGMHTQLTPLLDCPDIGEPKDVNCKPEALFATATNADIIRAFQTADPAFMAKKVRGHVLSAWPLWPPGMITIQSFFYWLSPALPIAFILTLLGCSLWALVLAQLAGLQIRFGLSRFIAVIVPLFLLLSPEFKYFLGLGVFYTESLSISAFLLGLGLLFSAVQTHDLRIAAIAGIGFAFSSYMRAQTDLVMTMTLLLSVFTLLVLHFYHTRSPRLKTLPQTFMATKWLMVIAVSILAYHAATFPWRITHHMQWIGFAESPIWHSTWQRAEELPGGLQFYTTGGGLAGCNVDPALCDEVHARAKAGVQFTPKDYLGFSLKTFATHPIQWLAFKLPYFQEFWFENTAEGVVLAVAFALTVITCLRKGTEPHLMVLLFLTSTSIGIWGPLLLTHIESRYLYELKLTVYYGAILALILSIRASQPRSTQMPFDVGGGADTIRP